VRTVRGTGANEDGYIETDSGNNIDGQNTHDYNSDTNANTGDDNKIL